jgi:hypothetical protein
MTYYNRIIRLIDGLIIFITTFYTTFWWHHLNKVLPAWDGGEYTLTAIRISEAFNKFLSSPGINSFINLNEFYFNRGARPISFPSISSVFFFIFPNLSINIVIGIFQWIVVSLIGIAVYKISRIFISPIKSLLVANFMVSMPWFLEYTHEYFYSEPLWILMICGFTLYYLKYSLDKSTKNTYWIGLFLGLAFTIRPAETLLTILVPILIIVVKEKINFNNLFFFGLPIIIQLTLFFIIINLSSSIFKGDNMRLFLLFLAYFVVLVDSLFLIKQTNNIIKVLKISFNLILLWYIPFYKQLYNWMYSSSFGDWAKLSNMYYGDSYFLTASLKQISYYAPKVLFVLFCIFLISLIKSKVDTKLVRVNLIVIINLLPTFFILELSKTGDPRKIMGALWLALLFCLITILNAQNIRSKLFSFLLLVTFSFHLFYTSLFYFNSLNFNIYGLQLSSNRIQPYFVSTFGIIRPPSQGGYINFEGLTIDPNRDLDLWVTKEIGSENKIYLYSHGVMATDTYIKNSLPILNHTAATLASFESGSGNIYAYEGALGPTHIKADRSELSWLIGKIKESGGDYLILDMFEGPIGAEVPNKNNQGLYLRTKFLIEQSKDQLISRLVKCQEVNNLKMCIYKI